MPSGLPVVITGMGKTAAATATAAALARLPDRSGLTVVNIGTAGALHSELTGLHEVDIVVNHDLDAAVIRALGEDPRERLVLRPTRSTP